MNEQMTGKTSPVPSIHLPPIVWGVVRMEGPSHGAVVDIRMARSEAIQAAKIAMANAGADDRHSVYAELALTVSVVPARPAQPVGQATSNPPGEAKGSAETGAGRKPGVPKPAL